MDFGGVGDAAYIEAMTGLLEEELGRIVEEEMGLASAGPTAADPEVLEAESAAVAETITAEFVEAVDTGGAASSSAGPSASAEAGVDAPVVPDASAASSSGVLTNAPRARSLLHAIRGRVHHFLRSDSEVEGTPPSHLRQARGQMPRDAVC